jgi:3'(2'), 5'-bisphosphate nucleotidase
VNDEFFDKQALADQVRKLCAEAGEAIASVYQSSEPLVVENKSDNSPVTIADKLSQDIIVKGLKALTPYWPILSEEQEIPPFTTRCQWQNYWLIDPLDGTREFIDGNGEFTINVALIENGEPIIGVVYLPIERIAYVGITPNGEAYRVDTGGRSLINIRPLTSDEPVKVLTSSRHHGDDLMACMRALEQHFSAIEWLQVGSALKFCQLAEGGGDIYPRFSPCSEWDTAAGQAVLEAAGGCLVNTAFEPFRYNQQNSLINPYFYALAGRDINWYEVLMAPIDPG